jgi:hypothetical protein
MLRSRRGNSAPRSERFPDSLLYAEEGNVPDERSRMEVVQALSEKLGPEVAAALMECVPPFAWTELPTKGDLAQLEERAALRLERLEAKLDGRFEGLEGRLEALIERKASAQNRALLLAVAAAVVVSLLANLVR